MYAGTHPMKKSPVGHGGQATLQHLEAATSRGWTSGCPAPGFLLGQLQPGGAPEALGARNAAGAVAEEGAFGTTTPEPSVMRSCWDGTWCWEMVGTGNWCRTPNSPGAPPLILANSKPKVNRTQDQSRSVLSVLHVEIRTSQWVSSHHGGQSSIECAMEMPNKTFLTPKQSQH